MNTADAFHIHRWQREAKFSERPFSFSKTTDCSERHTFDIEIHDQWNQNPWRKFPWVRKLDRWFGNQQSNLVSWIFFPFKTCIFFDLTIRAEKRFELNFYSLQSELLSNEFDLYFDYRSHFLHRYALNVCERLRHGSRTSQLIVYFPFGTNKWTHDAEVKVTEREKESTSSIKMS